MRRSRRPGSATAAGAPRPPRRGRRPATRPASRWRPAATCSACRRGEMSMRSSAAWLAASWPRTAVAISPLTFSTALRDALAHPVRAAVAQLGGLELARRGARRHRGAPPGARTDAELDLDGRVAAAVEDLAGVDVLDLAHVGGSRVVSFGSGVRGRSSRAARSAGDRPSFAPSDAARSPAACTRPRKRSAAARSASSGSTCSLRATLTAANSTSPSSWKRSSRARRRASARPARRAPTAAGPRRRGSQSRWRRRGAGPCGRAAARAGSRAPRRRSPARGRPRSRLICVPVAQHLAGVVAPRPRRTRAGGGGSASR